MFKRRKPQTLRQKLRNVFWPCMGWRRLSRYYLHRIGRLSGTPYYIAVGFANGVVVSLTPFLGFHLLLGAFMCWAMRGSVVAMVIGTVVAGNPWTFPVIWLVTYHTGHWLMGHADVLQGAAAAAISPAPHALSLKLLMESPMQLLLPMTVGSLPYLLPAWLAGFYGVRRLVAGYKRRTQDNKKSAAAESERTAG
ncbi:MAG: DUF2062 domain-containing protein [Alphaproteobacteria bacterium]|nr:DUF2062 domain-containing protein [Alphaproteobacteria bacterium]